jgi:hypothetical protein
VSIKQLTMQTTLEMRQRKDERQMATDIPVTEIYEMYNRKLREEGAATRTLLVIAAGHPDPVRLAKEVLRSKVGVTEEVLDAPMWKVPEDA